MAAPIPLTALRAFEAAARCGSFRAAAADLNLTPSAVSHAVRGLEQSLGAALFARDGRAVRLTPEGEGLMHHVERGFAELRRGIAGVAPLHGPMRLRLHCAPSFAAQWLVPRLPRLLAECPGLEVRLSASAEYPRFVRDEFDADIRYGPPRLEGVVALPLGEEAVMPLCAPALAQRIGGSVRALAAATLIESDNKRVRWPAWFAANGMPAPEPNGPRFDRSFLALAAAADGLGVALESLRLAERELADGRLVIPLAGRAQDVRYVGHWLVYPGGGRHGRALATFAAWLGRELGVELGLAG